MSEETWVDIGPVPTGVPTEESKFVDYAANINAVPSVHFADGGGNVSECLALACPVCRPALPAPANMTGKKFDSGKPKLSYVARSLMEYIASVMEPGAIKYGRDNWRGGMAWSRPYDALLRHLTAWWEGDGSDSDSGQSHLAHAACELMFLIEYEQKKMGQDDRTKPAGR